MAEEKKIVRGGFRATLALIVSIVALVLAFIAFNRTGGEQDLNVRIKDLQTRMESLKKESAQQMDKVRQETANALEKLSQKLKTEQSSQ